MGRDHVGERDPVTEPIIGAAIEVHRVLGPGLLESVYETCFCDELERRGIEFQRQVLLPVTYKGASSIANSASMSSSPAWSSSKSRRSRSSCPSTRPSSSPI